MKRLASAGKLRSRKHHEEKEEEGGRAAAVDAQDVRVEHATRPPIPVGGVELGGGGNKPAARASSWRCWSCTRTS